MIRKIFKIFFITLISLFLFSISLVILLRFVSIPTSSFILQAQLNNFIDDNDQIVMYEWVAIENISDSMKIAVIAAEDQKFLDHYGFDVDEIEKAFEQNRKGKRVRGASTITQQTAKNLFLWSGKSYLRKGLEAYFTILLELFWSKERILEVYLNIAEFGQNIYGVEAAAQNFYKVKSNSLTMTQSSLLAAVLPNPKRYKAKYPGVYIQRRAAWIRLQTRQLGMNILKKL